MRGELDGRILNSLMKMTSMPSRLTQRTVRASLLGLAVSARLIFGHTTNAPAVPQLPALTQAQITASAQKVLQAPGEKVERRTLERMRGDFPLWKTAADQNWPAGLYLIGECYVYGIEVIADPVKAFSNFRKAAESEHDRTL